MHQIAEKRLPQFIDAAEMSREGLLIGTSTGVAESGTVEEIDQFVSAGKPALLYFSSRAIDPNKIDLKQHKKLRSFKVATYNSLTASVAARRSSAKSDGEAIKMLYVSDLNDIGGSSHLGEISSSFAGEDAWSTCMKHNHRTTHHR
jgi:hypothetical protein